MSELRTDWVMPILVDKTGTHELTVEAAARACVLAWARRTADQQAAFDAWLSGPFTKSVRRASAAHLDRAVAELGGHEVRWGGSRGVALAPMRMVDLPKLVAKAQVASTDLERTRPAPAPVAGVSVTVLETLTTGKAAAQAAHALLGWALEADGSAVERVLGVSTGLHLAFTGPGHLRLLAARPGAVAIRDNGLTEVTPGTLTAVAIPTA
ncbi:hypothetical protein CHO01_37030 [Cellulomonas hominis]|uniref:Uncharacterized protein n=1 Tax=Cellulomonas hominis TaxID=156981 RepID=A0A511FJN4_9CELL|nr:hypothetical protein [Cellulomonas hominis]MBB5474711.1 hypothetical protein [Cellulomonas hominis]NKY06790.1 hypothetical protein [Cellulomonas hominis]GEL48587.1 hypothetical protein CHO01_37030 [Cellulomonas hominis]